MKYKFNTNPKTSKRMSKVDSSSGKDEIILAKKLWHKGIRYRKTISYYPVNLILQQSLDIKLLYSLMENFGMAIIGRSLRNIFIEIKIIG